MNGAAVDRVLSALRGQGLEPRRSGDSWKSCCPAHEDRNPSLSIRSGGDRALLFCHAGCGVDQVCKAIGLHESQLFDDFEHGNGTATGSKRTRKPTPAATEAVVFASAKEAVAEAERRKRRARDASWIYRDAQKNPVGVVLRWDNPKTGSKEDIRPVFRTEDGAGWIIGAGATPRLLYRLPELLATKPGDRVYVVEGEKSAEAAAACGLTATTSPGGANAAANADWSPMSGRDVVVLPDNDKPGEEYAEKVERLSRAAGAESVWVVRMVDLWPQLPEHGDIADVLEHRGGDAAGLGPEIEALASKAAGCAAPELEGPVVDFEPFPVDVLPEPVQSFVTEAAKSIGCNPSYVALPLLPALAAAIGNTRVLELKRGWTEPAIVWTAIVGESGTQKSPAFKVAMKATRAAQERSVKAQRVAMDKWESDELRYKAALEAWKRETAKKRTEHGREIPLPTKPAQPIVRRYVVSDTTVEALAPILKDNPRGVLLARDELNGWIGSFDQYKTGRGGADSAHWLSMHGGESMTIDRKTGTPPTIHVPSASVSIVGGIQPGILQRSLGPEHHESGLLARILFVMPPRRKKQWTDAEVSPEREAEVAGIFDALFDLKPIIDDEDNERPRVLRLSEPAKRAWVAFYNEHNAEQVNLSGDDAAAWSKLEGYAARFSLVVHLTRAVAAGSGTGEDCRVDEASVAAGVALARWFGKEAKRVYTVLGESDDDRESRQLVEWIRRRGGTVTTRDLTHGLRGYRGDAEAAEAALAALAGVGLGTWRSDAVGPRGGRPAQRFRLVSPVTVTETLTITERHVGSGDGDNGATPQSTDSGWGEL